MILLSQVQAMIAGTVTPAVGPAPDGRKIVLANNVPGLTRP